MATISIDFSSEKNEIYLYGEIIELKRHRFAWRYLKDYLNPIIDVNRIIIPVNDEEPIIVLSKVRAMLEKYSFRLIKLFNKNFL